MLTASSVLFSYNLSLFALHFLSRAVVSKRTSDARVGRHSFAGVTQPTAYLPAGVAVAGK